MPDRKRTVPFREQEGTRDRRDESSQWKSLSGASQTLNLSLPASFAMNIGISLVHVA